MKIIHLVPAMESGGVEQVVLELGRGFSRRGIDNVVVSAGGRLVEQLEREGSRHIAMPIGRKSLLTLLQRGKLARLIERERPDIVHIHSRVPAWVGMGACAKLPPDRRPPAVTTVHGLYSVNRYSAVMTKGERVIAVSDCVRDYVLRNYPATPAGRIRVIPNSIDPTLYNSSFTPDSQWLADWQRQYPELQGRYTLCLPGRLTRIKGHLDLIPVLKFLVAEGIPAHAVIVGEASRSKRAYKEELLEAFARAGLSERVTWTGHRSDLPSILSVCKVTLSPATAPESFGKTTLEALALGRPVAGYAHGGVEELLHAFFPEGLIPVGDTDALARRLASWYRRPPAVPVSLPVQYTFEGMIEHHLAVYRELLQPS